MRWGSLLGDRLARTAGYRPEIQALRAIAVTTVMLYHLWPSHMVGGYTGVDVFFVISGYLITGHLWKSAAEGRLSLSAFYARRVRRLAPASVFVLIAVVIATAAIVPFGQWRTYTQEVTGSALLVENWVLAGNSVDYLAAENTPSPVQHFWSLSVEEQFYLVWPLLILLIGLLLSRRLIRTRARATFAALAVIFVASLAFSIVYSHTNPAPAYFVTPTRVWQFAAGGMLALATPAGLLGRRERTRATARLAAVASWVGLAVIIGAAFLLDARKVEYPGAWALIPVLPTVLVIAAGSGEGVRFSPHRAYDLAPVQFLGTVSYPIYLWHWPLIVLAPYVIGDLHFTTRVAIGLLTIVLSALTTLFIENPIRFSTKLTSRRMLTVATAALASVLLVVVPSIALGSMANDRFAAQKAAAISHIFNGDKCYGALVMENLDSCSSIEGTVSSTAVSAAAQDEPQPFRDGCIDPLGKHTGVYCDYGDTAVKPTVLLWGDSHAAAWGGAFDVAGKAGNVHVIVGTRQGCPATEIAPIATVFRAIPAKEQGLCDAHNRQMLALVKAKRTIRTVVLASYSSDYIYGTDKASPDYYSGTVKLIEDLHALGVKVKLLGDVPITGSDPSHRVDIPDCLAKHLDTPDQCDNPRSLALATKGLRNAIKKSAVEADVTIIDTSSQFCDRTECYAMIGGLPVFFDSSHVSDSYSRSMGPWVLDKVINS